MTSRILPRLVLATPLFLAALWATGALAHDLSEANRAYVQTVTGQVHFDANGQNTDTANSALIFQWQPGQGGSGAPQFVQVLPSGIGTKNPILWAG